MICENYTASACVDGSCPMALKEEYPYYGDVGVNSCDECYHHKGSCDSCIFEDTDICNKEEKVE